MGRHAKDQRLYIFTKFSRAVPRCTGTQAPRSYVKVEVAVLGSPSLISLMVCLDVNFDKETVNAWALPRLALADAFSLLTI